MNIKDALIWGETILKESEVEGAKPSALFLLSEIICQDKVYMITHDNIQLTEEQLAIYQQWIERRSKHEPVWYITGKIEFGSLALAVNNHVLIPRPETEILIERIKLDYNNYHRKLKVLDVGTGSGTIILSLAKHFQDKAIFFASDISKDALEIALRNAALNDLSHLVEFRQGNLFNPWAGMKFDIVVANLPYVPHEDMSTLAPDLLKYEPHLALDGGRAGIEIYKIFLSELSNYLEQKARVYLEIGYEQGKLIKNIVQKFIPKTKVTIVKDYSNIDRIVIIES